MTLSNIFSSKKLLEQILWNELIDDGMTISCQLDLNLLPNLSPVHVLGEKVPFKFQTCVCQTDEDTLSLSIRSWPGNKTRDLSWPVVVQWKVSVINENTEAILDLNTVTSTFTQTTSQTGDLSIHLSEVKDFIDDNSLLLRWKLKAPNQPDTDTSSPESGPLTQSQTCERPSIKEEILAVLGLTQDIKEHFDTDQCREKISCLHRTLTEPSSDDVCFNSRIEKTDQRIDKLIEQFNEEAEKATQCLTVVRDATSHIQAWAGCVDESSDEIGESSSEGVDTSSDECEGPLRRRTLNFLLIGESQTGKSATGNSILLKNAFETGQQTSELPRVEKARITVSKFPTTVTVVEVSNIYLLDYNPTPFEVCPDGFDAILCIDDYRNIKKHNDPSVYSGLNCNFIDDEALKSYGIVVITGGDSFRLDHPNITIQDWFRGILGALATLEIVQNRVILFDNTTRSKRVKLLQLTKLVELVDSLATNKTRFTVEEFMESETRFMKSKWKNLCSSKDAFQVQKIREEFTYDKAFHHNEEWHRVMQTIDDELGLNSYSSEVLIRQADFFKVLIFGKPKGSVHTIRLEIEKMGITCKDISLDLITYLEGISDFRAILLVASCSQLLPQDKSVLRNVMRKYNDEISRKGILMVIDGGDVDLRGKNDELLQWCIKENDIIYDMLDACAGRSMLYDYETSDVVAKHKQETNLVDLLANFILTANSAAPDKFVLPDENPHILGHAAKRPKLL